MLKVAYHSDGGGGFSGSLLLEHSVSPVSNS